MLVGKCTANLEYDVEFKNDMVAGHLVFESESYPTGTSSSTEILIVGGGLSGLSAAYNLKGQNFLLAELSPDLGGTSSGTYFQNIPVCHGAHYDLSYPANYGEEGLKMLQSLGITMFDDFSKSWKFVDKQYLIPKRYESQTFAHSTFRKDVLPEGEEKRIFVDLILPYSGKMVMPTRIIEADFRELNDLSFLSWLENKYSFSNEFMEALDYHMKDDYGAGCKSVSALAGIHYFSCRPYYKQPVEILSPPEGNAYFVNKIADQLPQKSIKTSMLVKKIVEADGGFEVELIDITKKQKQILSCKKIIYAGNKHALKHIYPSDFSLFEKTEYAPWVVVNFIFKESWTGQAFWQNEIISENKALLGFVDSQAQFTGSGSNRVLTVYYCFQPEERKLMSELKSRKNDFIEQTISYLEKFSKVSLKKNIEKVFIKQMGHAMPIPKPGYLFSDANENRSNPNISYAGVDNGRLPLLFEAIDSGICAAKLARTVS